MGKTIAMKMLLLLVGQLVKTLTPDLIKRFADKMLDAVEDAVTKSENKIDDLFIPMIGVIRKAFNVPDND